MTYTSLAAVKAWLNIGSVNLDDDAQITAAVGYAQAIIDAHCRRTFEAAADTTRTFDALGEHIDGSTLYLDADLVQINAILNGDGTAITAGQYTLLPVNRTPAFAIRLKDSAGIAWTYTTDWEKAISITGRWAYSLTAPQDIGYAATRLAAYLYKQRDSYNVGLERAETTPMGVTLLPMTLPKDVTALLKKYVRL